MRTRRLLPGGLAISVIVLSGCGNLGDYLDPYKKPYAWHPTGAPDANIDAQLVNPLDRHVGRGAAEGDAKEATMAIRHVWEDTTKPIGSASTGEVAAGTGSGTGTGSSGSGPSGSSNGNSGDSN